MAFFSDGNNEYFSLNLNPEESDRSYVFSLNKKQIHTSQYFVRHLLPISICVFVTVACILIIEDLGLSRHFLSESDRVLLLLVLASVAALVALSEVVFFMWVKRSNRLSLSEGSNSELKGVYILKERSWMAYLIFLLNMLVPFISLSALHGGVSQFVRDNSNLGIGFLFFIAQLTIILLALVVFLIKRIITLITAKNVTCA